MKDPIERLKAFYEACDQSHPSRLLPDPALQPRLAARRMLGWALSALAPLFVGGGIALMLLTAGSTLSPASVRGAASPLLDHQLKQAGLSRKELSIGPKLPQGRTEVGSWRA